MQIQYQIPMLAAFGAPAPEPVAWVESASFEDCVRLAFKIGSMGRDGDGKGRRYTQRVLGTLAGIYPPHVSDVAAGKRPLKAQHVDALCWLSGCDAPRQWLDLQRQAIAREADRCAKEITWQQVRKAAA